MTDGGATPAGGVPAHGQVCYLQIPAVDAMASADFYEKVFGWRIERPYASFVAPALIGQWVEDRAPDPDRGPLLWILVDHMDDRLAQIAAGGGQVTTTPYLDEGARWLATILDPGGNTIGVVQLGPR